MNQATLGFSKIDITPKTSVEMVGFYRQDNKSRGILDPLYAEISLWTSNQEKYCFITLDHIGYMLEDANRLRDQIAQYLAILQDQVMLCFSHTHSSVNISMEPKYFDWVCNQVLKGVQEAEKNGQPIKAAAKNVHAEIGINRRDPQGALDDRIGIIKITNAITDTLQLIILRITAHANILYDDNYLISSDYFGMTRRYLEEKYHCHVMITQGASGNVEAIDQESSVDSLKSMAHRIIQAIDHPLDEMITQPIDRLKMYSKSVRFAADVPSLLRAQQIANEAMTVNHIDGTQWLTEVERVHALHITQQYQTIEIQYFYINDYALCGVPNEVMCELALEIAKVCPQIYFGGYTNGCTGYLPTAKEYDKGGYEVLHSYLIYYIYHKTLMPLNRDSADQLVKAVLAYRQDK